MEPGIRRLTFGWDEGGAADEEKGKGGGQGKGKGGKGKKGGGKMKPSLPISDSCFKKEPTIVRDKLGLLHVAKYPFDVKVRAFKDGQFASRQRHQRAQGSDGERAARSRAPSQIAKRRSESRGQERRSQTPRRYQQHSPVAPDPWAQAVQAQQQQLRGDDHMGQPPLAPASTSLPSAAAAAAASAPSAPSASSTQALQSGMRSEQQLQQQQPQQPTGPVMFGQRIHA